MQVSDYSNIYQLGSRNARNLFDGGLLVVQEKVDGSQFSFANVGGTLHCRSKNNAVDQNTAVRAFKTAQLIFATGTMLDGMVVRGEVLDKPKHNVLKYDRTPVGGIILYDIECPERSGNYESPNGLLFIRRVSGGSRSCPPSRTKPLNPWIPFAASSRSGSHARASWAASPWRAWW